MALLATSACALRSQVAYTFDGQTTTNDDVSIVADACAEALGTTTTISVATVINSMIHSDLAHLAADNYNIEYTDEELREPIESGYVSDLARQMLNNPTCAQLALGLTLELLVIDRIGVTEYQRSARQIPIVVNPRFGTWNKTELSVDGSGSLSQKDDQ